MVQLFDPNVCYRVESIQEADRLLSLAFDTFKPSQSRASDSENDDDLFGAQN